MNVPGQITPVRHGLDDSLDFINTLAHGRDGDTERLPDAAAAEAWLVGHGAVPPIRVGRVELDAIRSARQAMRELVDAVVDHRTPSSNAVARLNGILAAGDRPRLERTSDGVRVTSAHAGEPIPDALSHLVEPLVDLVARGDTSRLRSCDDESCRWVFFDESRTARRRWCDMSSCGNRAKAARHRARRRAGTSPDALADSSGVATDRG
jgi:predicted RNA-binding Zn ribbon-like protein